MAPLARGSAGGRGPARSRGAASAAAAPETSAQDRSNFLGISGSKEEQIAAKNSDIDREGIWSRLPEDIQKSLQEPGHVEFVAWLGHGVTQGKAAIVKLFTAAEADAIISCMDVDAGSPGVMSAERTAELYLGRVNTARHLISDSTLAHHLLQRFRACHVEDAIAGASTPLLSLMDSGSGVVAVGEKIRLVTTQAGGAHGRHADISEASDDGGRVSRLTFQCYLNPEAYEGGHFQLYPLASGGETAVDIPVGKGFAVIFVQEDLELQHGGATKGPGAPKRAIRGNLEVAVE